LPRIEQFGLASADELDLETLVPRLEAEAVTLQTQLIGPASVWVLDQKSLTSGSLRIEQQRSVTPDTRFLAALWSAILNRARFVL
jgi:hypothetical protein